MRKSLYIISFLILLAVAFQGGARFNQSGVGRNKTNTVARPILHYVDPMNPVHTSKKPGIAPCGMPMEPVYADPTTPLPTNVVGSALSPLSGTVNINLQKQQIIGVQVSKVTRATETYTIRALGRITPDENRVYPLIASTDGWMEDIDGSTTGSLVLANQVLAKIRVYNYDFFTWQQRYLTELNQQHLPERYAGRQLVPASPLAGTDQGRGLATSIPASMPGQKSESQAATSPKPADDEMLPMTASTAPSATPMSPGGDAQPSVPTHTRTTLATTESPSPNSGIDNSEHMNNSTPKNSATFVPSRDANTLYANRGLQELLNLGVDESQLQEFAKGGTYLNHVNLRSPIDGFVLSRKVSPRQKIERGTECFRIADLSKVWVETDIYDMDAKYIRPGMRARISLPKQERQFTATVSSIPPRFDAATRTLKVRLEMDNPGNALRPDMFVDVEFLITSPESITTPSEAVIDSGTRKTVYVAIDEGIFEPRAVVTGWQSSDRIEIVEGLHSGDRIVVSGNFLIDSESRMKLATTRLMTDNAESPPAGSTLPLIVPQPQTELSAETKEMTGDTIKDLVCGMPVSQSKAKKAGLFVETGGKTYYFCSEDCKGHFLQEPLHYTVTDKAMQKTTGTPDQSGHHHD